MRRMFSLVFDRHSIRWTPFYGTLRWRSTTSAAPESNRVAGIQQNFTEKHSTAIWSRLSPLKLEVPSIFYNLASPKGIGKFRSVSMLNIIFTSRTNIKAGIINQSNSNHSKCSGQSALMLTTCAMNARFDLPFSGQDYKWSVERYHVDIA